MERNHFILNFDISDMNFHYLIGKAILEVFYEKGIRAPVADRLYNGLKEALNL